MKFYFTQSFIDAYGGRYRELFPGVELIPIKEARKADYRLENKMAELSTRYYHEVAFK